MKNKNRLDILLIPPITGWQEFGRSVKNVPIGILVLLSSLKKSQFNASIFSASNFLQDDNECKSICDEVLSFDPKTIGFSTWCQNFPFVLRLAQIIKRKEPGIPIICGGPHISVVGKETLEICSSIDYVLVGEADHSLGKLLKVLLNNKNEKLRDVPGLIYRDHSGVIKENSKLVLEKNLDDLPIPAYHELDKSSGVRIDVGRGCPYKCTYCSTSLFFSRSYRMKSPHRILKEMDYCYNHLKNLSFGFAHDMLVLKKSYIQNLCEKIKTHRAKTGRKYTWTCSARTDCLSVDLLNHMSAAGCKAIFFGVESGSKKIQKQINKNLNLESAAEIIAETAKRNIKPVVSFMVGFPEENKDDLEASLKLIINLVCVGAWPQMTLLSVLPGTPIHEKYKDQLQFDEIYSGFTNAFLTEKEVQLVKTYPSIFSSFYNLPNKDFSRTRLDLIAKLVNYLQDFIPTIRLLKPWLENNLKSFNIYRYIDENIGKYLDDQEMVEPEYFFMVQSIKDYLYSIEKQDLCHWIWDVFLVDCVKAFLRTRFHQDQLIKFNFGSQKLNLKAKLVAGNYRWYPYQEVLALDFDISQTLHLDFNLNKTMRFKKAVHYYLIINRNGKQSKVHNILARDFKVLNAIGKESNTTKLLSFRVQEDLVKKFLKFGALERI